MEKIIIIGTGGLARDVTGWFDSFYEIVGYSDKSNEDHQRYSLPGKWFPETVTPKEAETNLAVVAIGYPDIRERVCNELARSGFMFPTLIHPSACVPQSVCIGEGGLVSPNVVFAFGAKTGICSYMNVACVLGHDSSLGAYCQVNPGAQIAGNVTIGDGTQIGSGAVILQERTVGSRVKVGSGAVVFSDVPDKAVVLGNPAEIKRFRE